MTDYRAKCIYCGTRGLVFESPSFRSDHNWRIGWCKQCQDWTTKLVSAEEGEAFLSEATSSRHFLVETDGSHFRVKFVGETRERLKDHRLNYQNYCDERGLLANPGSYNPLLFDTEEAAVKAAKRLMASAGLGSWTAVKGY